MSINNYRRGIVCLRYNTILIIYYYNKLASVSSFDYKKMIDIRDGKIIIDVTK